MTTSVESPGSINEFASRNNTDAKQALAAYTVELASYASALARERGLKVDELHEAGSISAMVTE